MMILVRMMQLMLMLGLVNSAWANVQSVNQAASGKTIEASDNDQIRHVAMAFLHGIASGNHDAVKALLATPTEGRLQEKLSLMMTRNIELIAGGDLIEEALQPLQIQGDWGLLLTRQQHPKADRDKITLSFLLLHKVEKDWRVVPKVLFNDPSLNISRNQHAQLLLRWFRSHQRSWTKKFVTPLVKDQALPDAMKHLAIAPPFNIDHLRDPFASYVALVSQHSKKVMMAHKAKMASRPKEVLEAFDISTLKLVGIYAIHGKRVAMLEDSQGIGHTVHVGNYMGKLNGKITAIDYNVVHLLEEVINPLGVLEHKEMLLTLAKDKDKSSR